MISPVVRNRPSPADGDLPSARVTVDFCSEQNHRYLYDDVTGLILPWSDLREAVLCSYLGGPLADCTTDVHGRFSDGEVASATRFIRHWADHYGAFVRAPRGIPPPPSSSDSVEVIRRNCRQLVLLLTEDCNLRCRYCAYSGAYDNVRTYTQTFMTPATARQAIDWFVSTIAPQRINNPRKPFALTFYGGEPLLNMSTLRAALEHVAARYPNLFVTSLTTNGTLLTLENAELLATYGVNTSVSLDGPAEEHDRERIDRLGRGTHGVIMKNLSAIADKLPHYMEHVSFLSVYSYKSNFDAIASFFNEGAGRIAPVMFTNPVASRGTSYWNAATASDFAAYHAGLQRRTESYKERRTSDALPSSFDQSLVGSHLVQVALRKRLNDHGLPCLPFTGACFPGSKVAVQASGALDICERVNYTYPIGTLAGGFDGERIGRLINMYQEAVVSACSSCPVTKMCGLCFANVLDDGTIGRPGLQCDVTRDGFRQILSDYVTIKEANPKVTFTFDSDTIRLEERLCQLT
jgi:uncharacterized protein